MSQILMDSVFGSVIQRKTRKNLVKQHPKLMTLSELPCYLVELCVSGSNRWKLFDVTYGPIINLIEP